MIKIGVDGRLLQGKLTGVGKYVLNLLNYICDNTESIIFSIYTNKPLECSLRADKITVYQDNARMGKIKPMVWSKLLSFRLINQDKPDIFFAGDAFVPLFIKAQKIVSVVHDLNAIIAPETMSRLRLVTDKLFFEKDIKKASVIITNSYGTADKLKQYHHIDTTLVVHPIMDKPYKVIEDGLVQEKLKSLNINYPYLLTVSTQEPRKNMDKTIKAFINLKVREQLKPYKLLLVGSKGWKAEHIQSMIQSYPGEVMSLGYVSDELMPYLYNGAKLFVFPSSYEGFGMPAREAMLCGTNVVVTDIPELREATFEKGAYINPENSKEFEDCIVHVIESGNIINQNTLNNTDQLSLLIGTLESLG
ncbi:glycosyltransferase family 4 protein [Mucilaginibacter robiniae]|uniref:Glycosyltransferase family 4 protein n=1 Tax=Mucilaginibacter robiniae TaxID=2728022 RepID=A0A7L5E5H2_9SPHI|nr:glycosyltransferase family 1 protein [Mucilaginibacter robiniae]QJD97559.1 glycosyltransferase family 4 protein [Mucilaginibacter robiniae]